MLALLAALTVTSPPDLGCADRSAIVVKLRASGVTTADDVDVRVRFFAEGDKRVAEVRAGEAAPRRIEHQGSDCASLTDATVALLSVLLDEIAENARREAAKPPPPPPPPGEPLPPVLAPLRFETGAVGSNGIVADVAIGITAGIAWRPTRWASLGLGGDIWPVREHALREGRVSISAWTLGLALCAGHRWTAIALEGCVVPHGGRYALSAEGFPVVRPVNRGIFGAELGARISVAIAGSLAVFVRGGVWVPVTRLDVTVRGASEAGFATTSIGPKAAIGFEIAP